MAPLEELMRNSGANYGYEWSLQLGSLHLARSAGDDDGILYSNMSAMAKFSPGEGCVGKAFASKQTIFIKDVSQATGDFFRKQPALEDGLQSIAFIPQDDLVLELCFSKPLSQLPCLGRAYEGGLIVEDHEASIASIPGTAKMRGEVKALMGKGGMAPPQKCEKCGSGEKEIEDLARNTQFFYQPMFEHANPVDVPYKRHEHMSTGIKTVEVSIADQPRQLLFVEPWVLTKLSEHCIEEIQHFLRPGHIDQLAKILSDPEASENDRFAARNLLQNAVVAAQGILPGCQDTGTAIVMGKRGQNIFTDGDDEKHISLGIYEAYAKRNLRYSQVAPTSMFAEKNTKTNLPAQVDILAAKGSSYEFLVMAKGGGSANKTYLYQQTKALLNPKKLKAFVVEKLQTLGTSACPPYHVALVIGGTSAETCLKTVKLASARYYDDLPTSGSEHGRAFRDLNWEANVLELCRGLKIGAQFGGKYFAHDVRVVRLPRHGASCPVGLGVSCSADRQILAKINAAGVFVEQLEHNPARVLPSASPKVAPKGDEAVHIDLNRPMKDILAALTQCLVKTRVSLTGPLIVARDIAHAKLDEQLEKTGTLPDYVKNHPIYYAGPAKTPKGFASGSFGPTTAGRMDTYVPTFQKHGASLVTLAKGNRTKQVTDSCKRHGGFYLGSIGGAAAVLASENIKKVEVVEFEDLGMEAVWKIEVDNFPAFVLVDDKGNDFFSGWNM